MSVPRRRIADPTLVALAMALSVFGIAMVYSAGQTDVPTAVATLYRQQIVWFVLGVSAAYAVSRASVRFLDWVTVPAYAVSIFLLFLLLFVGAGAGTAASTKSWLAIGGVRLGQPSELAKIAVVLMLARILASRREAPRSLLDLWQPGLAVFVPWVLIMRQPDLGTGIVFVGIFFAMLFWAGASWQLLVLVASPVVSLILAFSTGLW
ncbi:MAG: FtsW/RodA/SpoVE family cell cycle protein, partial [Gemmatimonadaceae bacterium]